MPDWAATIDRKLRKGPPCGHSTAVQRLQHRRLHFAPDDIPVRLAALLSCGLRPGPKVYFAVFRDPSTPYCSCFFTPSLCEFGATHLTPAPLQMRDRFQKTS